MFLSISLETMFSEHPFSPEKTAHAFLVFFHHLGGAHCSLHAFSERVVNTRTLRTKGNI